LCHDDVTQLQTLLGADLHLDLGMLLGDRLSVDGLSLILHRRLWIELSLQRDSFLQV